MPGRTTATIAGAVAIAAGAWGAIIPYVAHALHYSADGSATWTWNLQHGLLSLLPGAMAVVAGALLAAGAWVRPDRASASHRALLIGATALHFGYAVGTRNLRHFHMIPNLAVIQL